MASPKISPSTPGSSVYTVHDAKALVADLNLAVGTTSPFPVVEVRYPNTANPQVTLTRGTQSLPLLPSPIQDTTTFAGRQVKTSTLADGTDLLLMIEIRAFGPLPTPPNEAWSVRAEAGTPQSAWQFTQYDNTPTDPTITQIMCDPAAGFTIQAPTLTTGTVREGDTVTLTAVPPEGTATEPTVVAVVGTSPPIVAHKWSKTGDVAIPSFPTTCSATQKAAFTTPGVYTPKPITITHEVWFETGCPGPVGLLNSTSAPEIVTIHARPEHLVLVLDRSGSMAGPRWDNAITAAQILGNLFLAIRAGVHTGDRVGEFVFEDTSCTWHTGSDPMIQPVLPLSDLGSAEGTLCEVDFGSPGSCTPIGDGLVRAIDELAQLPTQSDPRHTVVLLTDGFENSGSVFVSPNTPIPAGASGVKPFSVARQTGLGRQRVNKHLSLYTIGLGATVQEDVLNVLAAQSQGVYRKITQVSEIAAAMAQMLSFSQTIGCPDPDANNGAAERYVNLEPRVNRLAVAVLWSYTDDTIELAWRLKDSADQFTPAAATVQLCPTHGLASFDVTSLFDDTEESVPATEWRIRHLQYASPMPIYNAELLVFVDLFVHADIVFNRDEYGTGDAMVLTARIRAGDEPVTDAKVAVELARPGESLGTFLATNGSEYRPSYPSLPDPHSPKASMMTSLFESYKLPDGLPVETPYSIFEDGSNELYDDGKHHNGEAGIGNFTNRYVELNMEGTYTWRLNVSGHLSDGSPFSRVMTVSKWVGITPDPDRSSIFVNYVQTPEGVLTEITVYPRDRNGNYLGPFRPDDVIFRSSTCPFRPAVSKETTDWNGVRYSCRDGGTILSRYDGGYSRVLDCDRGTENTVTITVRGVSMPPVVIGQ